MTERADLEYALNEIARVAGLCIHQNTGRWSMKIEHDKRSYDILERIRTTALDAIRNKEETK